MHLNHYCVQLKAMGGGGEIVVYLVFTITSETLCDNGLFTLLTLFPVGDFGVTNLISDVANVPSVCGSVVKMSVHDPSSPLFTPPYVVTIDVETPAPVPILSTL